MLEILIPLHNPTEVLTRTIDSLLGQKKREFSVLLSDNHSVSGQTLIKQSKLKLSKAGLNVRLVRPPMELKRVEHWNWIHFQSESAWLKPLLAGDWLEPEYITAILREIKMNPQCSYLYCPNLRQRGKKKHATGAGRYYSASEMQQRVLRSEVQFGPPSVAAYRREAFLAMGGYRTTLSICADSLFFCTLASRFGGVELVQSLCNVHPQEADLSISRQRKQAIVFWEKIIFLLALTYHAFTENVPFPRWSILRRIALEIQQRVRERLDLSTP